MDVIRKHGGTPPTPLSGPVSDLARLCRYYLECIGQDSGEGVSAFAASTHGEPGYAELPEVPLTAAKQDWWNSPRAARVLNAVRADRTNLVAWLGYPVRLRKHRTARWEGFFVEPVMLWQIVLPENHGDPCRLQDDLPSLNFAFLRSLAMGDPSQVIEEAARLGTELGLNAPPEEHPEPEDLLQRLVAMRPDWDWRESLNPDACSQGTPLSEMTEQGIYNRAVILPGKRSPYTQGLESELRMLADAPESAVTGTALGAWLSGDLPGLDASKSEPLIEVLPMNSEQRAAVRSSLSAAHTVVTGPPGTGKSQVVTNLLVNAAWRGMRVLFASKNNKAVDVVEARVNGLGNRPVLLRLGSKEYQAKLSAYLTAMLSGNVSSDDELSYAEGLERHQQLADRITQLDDLQAQTLAARNLVDRLDAQAEDYRVLFGNQRFNSIDAKLVKDTDGAIARYVHAINELDPAGKDWLAGLLVRLFRTSKLQALGKASIGIAQIAGHLGLNVPSVDNTVDIDAMRNVAADLTQRIAAARKVVGYQLALAFLRESPAFEDIARQRHVLTAQVARNSAGLWRDWVQLTPKRVSVQHRREIADYAALLKLMVGADAQTVAPSVRKQAKTLQQKVTGMFSCWAVTALSARGKLPFAPAFFDLVVIDEASQCDIASALPLLYRAKRAVIIGDPMQLRHISALTRQTEGELQEKYGLVAARASWMYSVNSLYDLAAARAVTENIINLRDHHRSHADIIEFSNRVFYGGKLRVATRYDDLKRPSNGGAGVVWLDIKGKTIKPGSGGAENHEEARALVDALHDLLIRRRYQGTVGVVTPFRAQAQLIQALVSANAGLTEVAPRCAMLIDTVHRFQGDERDVMFFSPVISSNAPAGAVSFLRNNGNLFNVAITRARSLLHVVGDRVAAVNSGVDYLSDFAAYVSNLADDAGAAFAETVGDCGPEYPAVSRPERVSDWEHVLYRALYRAGLRPIPQYSIEQYDLDFAIIVGNCRLNIEVDGERYHRSWTGELCLRDQLRNQRLIELGWDVKRFWVYEIRDRLEECVSTVQSWVAAATDS